MGLKFGLSHWRKNTGCEISGIGCWGKCLGLRGLGWGEWSVIFTKYYPGESYVYWTVHHLDSWIKRDQLDVTCFIISLFNARHVSDVNTSILRSLRIICWVISWVVLHTGTTPPQPYHNETPTHIEPDQFNPCNNSPHKSQAPKHVEH